MRVLKLINKTTRTKPLEIMLMQHEQCHSIAHTKTINMYNNSQNVIAHYQHMRCFLHLFICLFFKQALIFLT